MAVIQVTNTFVINTRAKASEVNRNFSDLTAILRGDHHNPAVYSDAQMITTSGIAPNAQIRDTQLFSQITRSGLINQSSLGQIDTPGIITADAVPNTSAQFGDGSDGDVTISSPTTLTRDMYYNNLTVNDVLSTGGYRIFVKNTIQGSGTVQNNGNNGSNASGHSAGTAGAATIGYFTNTPGVDGASTTNAGVGNTGNSPTASLGSNASAGGASGNSGNGNSGTSGGPAGTLNFAYDIQRLRANAISGVVFTGITSFTKVYPQPGAGSGACGASPASNQGGGGGGSGASGGVVFIAARIWAGTFTIKSTGGTGGNGGNGLSSGSYGGGGGGGGAGGNGGSPIIIYNLKTWTGSYVLTGGTGGTHGNGGSGSTAAGTAGSDGSNGATGTAYELSISTLL